VTTATEGGVECRVLALAAGTGRVVWEREVFRQKAGHKQGRNTYATPTPVTDGQRVYAVFGDGSFVALDFSGEKVWENRELPFYSEHGLGTSPILWRDLLIMARDGSSEAEPKTLGWQQPWDQSFMVALDSSTGKVRWKTGRGWSRIAHVTPNLWEGPPLQVVSGAGDVVQGFDAATGALLWTSRNVGEGVVPSIVLGEGLAFTASGWGGRESVKAFRLGVSGDQAEANLVWEQRKGMPRVPSFLYVQPRLFLLGDNGVLTCLKAATGEMVWQERLGGSYSASPVAAEGRIYATSDTGETTVVAAGGEFKILARNALQEKMQASMAVAAGRLFIRTAGNLYCIGQD
jgi:outer membrane protein assembly factor BamB